MNLPFRVVLGAPSEGWLPVELAVGEASFELEASDALNDPLCELADVAVALADQSAAVAMVVRIFEEPGFTELRFSSAAGGAEALLCVHDVDGRQDVCSSVYARAELRDALRSALERFAAALPRTDEIAGWGQFPRHALRTFEKNKWEAPVLPPWEPANDPARIAQQIKLETRARAHPLHGLRVRPVAVETSTDRYLVEIESGNDQYAVVRLRWNDRPGRSPLEPETTFFRTWGDWVRECMSPDSLRQASRGL